MNALQQRRSNGVFDRSFASILLAVLFSFSFRGRAQTQPLLLGDLDADNRPTVIDLQKLINHLNGTNLLPASLRPYGDINEDGVINTNDLIRCRANHASSCH